MSDGDGSEQRYTLWFRDHGDVSNGRSTIVINELLFKIHVLVRNQRDVPEMLGMSGDVVDHFTGYTSW